MTLGPTAFAAVVWGAVLAVLVILAYQVYTLAVDVGWLDPGTGDGTSDGEVQDGNVADDGR